MSERLSHRPTYSKRYSQPALGAARSMTEEEVDQMLSQFAKEDNSQKKTWSRIVVENFLSKYRCYFPRRDARSGPSLSKAYAYYEHVTLPRRIVSEQSAANSLRRAEPGDNTEDTELYDPFRSPSSAFSEFGVGVDLYFSTVRIMAFLLLLAGIVNLPNIIFYGSTAYSANGKDELSFLSFSLKTTAVCTTGEWVVCPECKPEQFNSEDLDRFQEASDGSGNPTLLVLRNACQGGQLSQGMVNYATSFVLVLAITLLSFYLRAREVRVDEDKLSAVDYSIVVRNPPREAYDPDQWHAFFSRFAEKQVTAVTVALNNEKLLEKLIARRYHLRNLRLILPRGTDIEDEDAVRVAVAELMHQQASEPQGCIGRILDYTVFPVLHLFSLCPPPDVLCDKAFKLNEKIKELQKQKYDVASVFVTFETEEGQRAALSAFEIGRIDVLTNNTSHVAPGALFQDKLLKVSRPPEPSSVRYLDLGSSFIFKMTLRIVNFFLTIAVVSICGFAVARTRAAWGARYSGPLVSIFNVIIPLVIKVLMILEKHASEGGYQTSLYLKITLFRWVNTAILTKIITPFTSTLTPDRNDALSQINAILWSELFLVPCLRLLDVASNFKKHVQAPRARNQEIANLCFQGTPYNLGERYTDLTKIMFTCFFYSALFPGCFFFGFAILIVQYYTDKYCLMRIWAWVPDLGSSLARFSRQYFFSGALLSYVLVSAYAWAQFPYDNLCDPVNPSTQGLNGTYSYMDEDGNTQQVPVTQETPVEFCNQFWRFYDVFSFPPTSRVQPPGLVWMKGSQERLADIYGWSAVGALTAFVIIFFGNAIKRFLLSWFRGVREPETQNQHIDFSSAEISAYVPQIKVDGFGLPFLACDVDHIDKDLIGWRDPSHHYDYHNLIFDVAWEGMPREKYSERDGKDGENSVAVGVVAPTRPPIFSTIKHYPPPWTLQVVKEGVQ